MLVVMLLVKSKSVVVFLSLLDFDVLTVFESQHPNLVVVVLLFY